MKKLILLTILCLGVYSSSYAGEVYSCKYKAVEVSGNNVSNILSPDITLIVDRKQVTTVSINPIDGKSYREVFKILKQDKRFGLVALEKKHAANSVSTLYFNKKTRRFSMSDLVLYSSTGYSGSCTFMYSQ